MYCKFRLVSIRKTIACSAWGGGGGLLSGLAM